MFTCPARKFDEKEKRLPGNIKIPTGTFAAIHYRTDAISFA